MFKRRKFVKNYLNEYIPNVIINLINEYDYYFSGECEITLKGHSDVVRCCATLHDGPSGPCCSSSCFDQRIISGSDDGTLKIWNLVGQTGICEMTLEHKNSVICCTVLSDGRFVSVSDGDKGEIFKIWNIRFPTNASEKQTISCEITFELRHSEWIYFCNILSDGRIVYCCNDGGITTWNIYDKEVELFDGEHNETIFYCNLLPDGRMITSCNKKIKIWNTSVRDVSNLQITNGIYHYPPAVDINNTKIINCDITIEYYNYITCCAIIFNKWDTREFRIVSGSDDETLKIWNVDLWKQAGKYEMNLRGHSSDITFCAVLPNGQIVSGSSDNTVKVWNPKIGKCKLTMKGHHYPINCCADLSDGPSGCSAKRMITGSYDCTLKIWS
jgi:WD40 repeat protein